MAYQAALSFEAPLGGLLALSTYFATADSATLSEANRGLPIEVHHGSFDPVVPESLGKAGYEKVRSLGYPAHYHRYPMAHALCPQQIGDIGEWLAERLAR